MQHQLSINHEYECSIIAKNPVTNKLLPYDNDVVIEDKHLIIEVNGEQHYIADGWNATEAKRLNITPQEALEYLQCRDKIKMEYALSQNYSYLVIPYWTESDESYKTLIDEKIHEILTLNNTKL